MRIAMKHISTQRPVANGGAVSAARFSTPAS
jgi:hypothetical protein